MSSGGQYNLQNGGRGGRGGRGGGYAGGRTGRGTLRSRGTGGGYAGRGRGAPMQQFDLRSAPTGLASMRTHQQGTAEQERATATRATPRGGAAGWGRGHGHGHGHGTSGEDGKAPDPASADTLKEKKAQVTKDMTRFFAPRPPYVDQSALGHRGIRSKYSNCMRCREFKGDDHPDFVDCKEKCDLCNSYDHEGKMCGRVYASVKWHMEHNGFLPEEVQFRPSPEQCKERLAQYERRFKEYEDELADAQRAARDSELALKQSESNAQQQLKKYAQKEKENGQLCKRVNANVEEICTLKDAFARRDRAEAEAKAERFRLVEEKSRLAQEKLSAATEAAKWKSLYEQTNARLQTFEALYHELRNRTMNTIREAPREVEEQSIQLIDLDLKDAQADLDAERAENAEHDGLLAAQVINAQILEKKKQLAEAEARRRERKQKKWADRKAEQGLDDEIDWDNLSDLSTDLSTDASDDDTMDMDDGRKDQDKDEDKEEKSNSA